MKIEGIILNEKVLDKNSNWILLALISITALFRFYKIEDASLWVDEAFSIFYAQQPISNIIERATQGVNPPFYNILLHYWIKLFGISEYAVRSLSAIFSILSTFLIFQLARKYLNIQTAIFSAGLLLVSSMHQYYAHEARGFAMISFLCLVSFISYFSLFEKSKRINAIILALSNILLLYSHLITGFLILGQLIGVLLFYRNYRPAFKYYIGSFVLLVLAYLPWLFNIYNVYVRYESGKLSTWLTKPTVTELKWMFIKFASNELLMFVYLGFIIIAIGVLKRFKIFSVQKFNRNTFWMLILWGFFPVLACFIFSQFIPVFWPRYLMYSSLGLILFVSYLISILPAKSAIRTLIFLFFFGFSFGVQNLNPYKGENWKQAVPIVHENCTNNSLIILSAWYCHRVFAYYYDQNSFEDYESTVKRLKDLKVHCTNKGTGFEKINTEGIKRIILIQAHKAVVDPKNTLFKAIDSKYSLTKEQDYSGVSVSVFDQ